MRSIRYCFSAATSMAAEVVRELKARMQLDIHETYDMSESTSTVPFKVLKPA